MDRRSVAVALVLILLSPLAGSVAAPSSNVGQRQLDPTGLQLIEQGQITKIPQQGPIWWNPELDWWQHTSLDIDRNGIHDSLQFAKGSVNVGLSYAREVTTGDIEKLEGLGFDIHLELPIVDALLLGDVDASEIWQLAEIDGVVMVERYGSVVFYGDVQTPAVKAKNSSEYPVGAWDFGVTGKGINIAMVDTGVDNEHPGLNTKFVAGYDAVCYMHSDPQCILAGGREDDGSFDPDDGNQHGTACMGMASATGIEADGSQSEFYGSAPDAGLVDVRIGTDVGAGPFENYLLEQEFYESAMNGLQWIIDHRDDAWPGVEEESHGIDIISLSWGITSHENGGSDGTDMHSRILDEAMELGVAVSNAAGNSGEDNDGLSGMSASSLSITVASTDDQNTINRTDDTIAGYSSRGPRKDNGDGNPVNELIPEISAPGTNIVQAEGCVSSGGCNNFLGGDASQNTYTGRGSGTSYAAPAVTGVVALVWEANENLTPLQIKEVLKHTAELRGEASAPDVDPYWNREYGYGMVDALAAVELALFLQDSRQTPLIDPTLQSHRLNLSMNGVINMTGHSWGQAGSIDRVEYRIDDGDWVETTYSATLSEIGALTPFLWHILLDSSQLSSGNHTVEVHAVAGAMHSLPVFFEITGTESDSGSLAIPPIAIGIVVVVALAWVASLVLIRIRSDDEIEAIIDSVRNFDEIDEVVEAELLD
ncbi:MAG: S8 family serine peptidase [Candidatus Poseidoniales archaeon]|nr:S8 family serine peptidase [Candidatus Poseidoniales archaeon]|tara:strand:- start:11648 stop:13768 length:2121 start_codon:yes stop_codon:yes gene_type:complete